MLAALLPQVKPSARLCLHITEREFIVMRNSPKSLPFLSFALVLSGCSSIPDYGEIPGVEPVDIIEKVRCELSRALQDKEYTAQPTFVKTQVAYGLTLKAQQKHSASASVDLVKAITLGTLNLTPSASVDGDRSNELVTNLGESLEQLHGAGCPEHHGDTSRYPITGDLGLGATLRRYFRLNQIAETTAEKGYGQTFKFKLTYKGGLKPGFSIKQPSGSSGGATFSVMAEREDEHTLEIAFAPPPPNPTPPLAVKIVNLKDLKLEQIAPPSVNKSGPRILSGEPPAVDRTPQPRAPNAALEIVKQRQLERAIGLRIRELR